MSGYGSDGSDDIDIRGNELGQFASLLSQINAQMRRLLSTYSPPDSEGFNQLADLFERLGEDEVKFTTVVIDNKQYQVYEETETKVIDIDLYVQFSDYILKYCADIQPEARYEIGWFILNIVLRDPRTFQKPMHSSVVSLSLVVTCQAIIHCLQLPVIPPVLWTVEAYYLCGFPAITGITDKTPISILSACLSFAALSNTYVPLTATARNFFGTIAQLLLLPELAFLPYRFSLQLVKETLGKAYDVVSRISERRRQPPTALPQIFKRALPQPVKPRIVSYYRPLDVVIQQNPDLISSACDVLSRTCTMNQMVKVVVKQPSSYSVYELEFTAKTAQMEAKDSRISLETGRSAKGHRRSRRLAEEESSRREAQAQESGAQAANASLKLDRAMIEAVLYSPPPGEGDRGIFSRVARRVGATDYVTAVAQKWSVDILSNSDLVTLSSSAGEQSSRPMRHGSDYAQCALYAALLRFSGLHQSFDVAFHVLSVIDDLIRDGVSFDQSIIENGVKLLSVLCPSTCNASPGAARVFSVVSRSPSAFNSGPWMQFWTGGAMPRLGIVGLLCAHASGSQQRLSDETFVLIDTCLRCACEHSKADELGLTSAVQAWRVGMASYEVVSSPTPMAASQSSFIAEGGVLQLITESSQEIRAVPATTLSQPSRMALGLDDTDNPLDGSPTLMFDESDEDADAVETFMPTCSHDDIVILRLGILYGFITTASAFDYLSGDSEGTQTLQTLIEDTAPTMCASQMPLMASPLIRILHPFVLSQQTMGSFIYTPSTCVERVIEQLDMLPLNSALYRFVAHAGCSLVLAVLYFRFCKAFTVGDSFPHPTQIAGAISEHAEDFEFLKRFAYNFPWGRGLVDTRVNRPHLDSFGLQPRSLGQLASVLARLANQDSPVIDDEILSLVLRFRPRKILQARELELLLEAATARAEVNVSRTVATLVFLAAMGYCATNRETYPNCLLLQRVRTVPLITQWYEPSREFPIPIPQSDELRLFFSVTGTPPRQLHVTMEQALAVLWADDIIGVQLLDQARIRDILETTEVEPYKWLQLISDHCTRSKVLPARPIISEQTRQPLFTLLITLAYAGQGFIPSTLSDKALPVLSPDASSEREVLQQLRPFIALKKQSAERLSDGLGRLFASISFVTSLAAFVNANSDAERTLSAAVCAMCLLESNDTAVSTWVSTQMNRKRDSTVIVRCYRSDTPFAIMSDETMIELTTAATMTDIAVFFAGQSEPSYDSFTSSLATEGLQQLIVHLTLGWLGAVNRWSHSRLPVSRKRTVLDDDIVPPTPTHCHILQGLQIQLRRFSRDGDPLAELVALADFQFAHVAEGGIYLPLSERMTTNNDLLGEAEHYIDLYGQFVMRVNTASLPSLVYAPFQSMVCVSLIQLVFKMLWQSSLYEKELTSLWTQFAKSPRYDFPSLSDGMDIPMLRNMVRGRSSPFGNSADYALIQMAGLVWRLTLPHGIATLAGEVVDQGYLGVFLRGTLNEDGTITDGSEQLMARKLWTYVVPRGAAPSDLDVLHPSVLASALQGRLTSHSRMAAMTPLTCPGFWYKSTTQEYYTGLASVILATARKSENSQGWKLLASQLLQRPGLSPEVAEQLKVLTQDF